MGWKKVLGVALVVAGLSLPAAAYYVEPQDVTPSSDYQESPLYQIYNELYGTSYTSSAELAAATQENWEVFDTADLGDYDSITLEAVWRNAYMQENVGIYTTSSDGTVTYSSELLQVDGIDPSTAYASADPADLRGLGITATIDPDGTFGFYDDPALSDGSTPPWGTLHSEASLNYFDAEGTTDSPYPPYSGTLSDYPNMLWETHFLILDTPYDDTYLVCIEDLPYGHVSSQADYNDFLFTVTINRTVVPEPASMALLGLGIVGLVVRRIRKRA